jgi:hypothetical protein
MLNPIWQNAGVTELKIRNLGKCYIMGPLMTGLKKMM